MADITLATFKSRLKDGARPNRFIVEFTNPVGGDTETLSFFVKAASIPGRTIGNIPLKWQGMTYKIAGDPAEFEDWTVTFYNDYDGIARRTCEDWANLIANLESNDRTDPTTYMTDMKVTQLGRNGENLAAYKLQYAFISNVANIELAYETSDTLEEFAATITYSGLKRED